LEKSCAATGVYGVEEARGDGAGGQVASEGAECTPEHTSKIRAATSIYRIEETRRDSARGGVVDVAVKGIAKHLEKICAAIVAILNTNAKMV